MKNLELIAIVASIVLLGAYVLFGLIRAQQTQRRKQGKVKSQRSKVKSPREATVSRKTTAVVLMLTALSFGQSAWAASSWTVTPPTHDSNTHVTTFTVTRTGDLTVSETVRYSTIGLSAAAGQNFTAVQGQLTFGPDENSKSVAVTELTKQSNPAFAYQTGTARSYRFMVTDMGGFYLAHRDRAITTGTSISGSIIYNVKNLTIQTDEYKITDDGYDKNAPKYISGSTYFNAAAPSAYFSLAGAELRMTLTLDAKESDDGYQYLSILTSITAYDNRSDCDNGNPGNINNSLYMAGFEHNTGSKDENYKSYTFPVTSVGNNAGASNPWNLGTNYILSLQKFNTNRRASDGRLILPLGFSYVAVRGNASGKNEDDWYAKNVIARIQAVDMQAPRVLNATANPGMHAKGDTVYVSVAFSEIVTVTGSPTLTTSWGSLGYLTGSGSNVLTFRGMIPANAGSSLTLSGFSSSSNIKDLGGKSFSGSLPGTSLCSLDKSYVYPITYDLAGGEVTGNPSAYVWETPAFTLTNPTRTGWTFDGWTGTGLNAATSTAQVAQYSHGDRSYTANWTAHTYTVRFHANGGSGTMADQSFTYDQEQALKNNAYNRQDYSFLGWSTTPDGDVVYANRDVVSNLTAENEGTIDLYAQWESLCDTITSFPWNEDFESYSTITFTAPCWINEHIEGNGRRLFKISKTEIGGNTTKQLQLPDMNDGTRTKLALPLMDLPGDNYLFSLDIYRNAKGATFTAEGIRIFVSADGNINGATELAFISRNFTQTDGKLIPAEPAEGWYTYEIPLGVSGPRYIILRGESMYGSATYMDNFCVKQSPSCQRPTDLAATDITNSSATLSWTAHSSESQWDLYYKKNTEDNYSVVSVSSNPYTLSGLDYSSKYQFYVVAKCSEADSSAPSRVAHFTTLCGTIHNSDLPWIENFDAYSGSNSATAPYNYPDDELPLCWRFLNRSSQINNLPQVFVSSFADYVVSGNCLFFKSYYQTPLYAVLPEFEENINNLLLTFTYRNESVGEADGILHVGYMTNPDDATTFTRVYSCPRRNTLTEEKVLFHDAPAGSYIAFKYEGYLTSNYFVSIDSVQVEMAPVCCKPNHPFTSDVDAHTAVLHWETSAAETAWQIMLNDDEEHLIDATTNPFTLTDLAADTRHTVKVRANCGESYSAWSHVAHFKTLISCHAPVFEADDVTVTSSQSADISWSGSADSCTVRYRIAANVEGVVETFDSRFCPDGWSVYKGCLNNDGTATLESNQPALNFENTNGVFDSHAIFNIYGNTKCEWLVTPQIIIHDSYTLRFDLALTTYNGTLANPNLNGTDDRFAVLISTDEKQTWTVLRQWDNNADSKYVYNDIACSAVGEEVTIDLSDYAEQNVYIAFYGESMVTNADNNVHIDNVQIGNPDEVIWSEVGSSVNQQSLSGLTPETKYEVQIRNNCGGTDGNSKWTKAISFTTASECQLPNQLTATNITSSSATISWNTYSQTGFRLRYSTDGENWTIIDNATSPQALSALAAKTTYSVQVQLECNPDIWSPELNFRTDCETESLPFECYFQNEEDLTCWSMVNLAPDYGVNYGYFGFCYSTNPPQYLISPELATSEHAVKVRFVYRAVNSDFWESFKVGYSSTNKDVNSFTWSAEVKTNDPNDDLYSMICPAGTKYVAIQYTAYDQYFLEIGNFRVSEVTPSQVSFGSSEYATFYGTEAFTVPGATVYKAALNQEGDALVLTELEGVIPANSAVILKGTAEGTAAISYSNETPTANMEGNILEGTPEQVTTESLKTEETNTLYAFDKNASVFIPYMGEYFPAGKAFFQTAATQTPSDIHIEQENHITTDLQTVEDSKSKLQGRGEKFLRDGVLYFLYDGLLYDALGRKISVERPLR